ncbi:MAG: CDP-alcohol phosphatidyltransferase family protein [Gemmatimonadota bacterium]
MRFRTWPNAISLLRLPLAAAFVAAESALVRGLILATGAVTDYVDGWLARRTGQRSRSGEVLDGIVDKVFGLAALGTFTVEGLLEPWQLTVLLARDLFSASAFLVALLFRMPIRFRSRQPGKIVTGLQLLVVLVLLVRPGWVDPLVLVTGAVALWAILDYLRVGLASLRSASRSS